MQSSCPCMSLQRLVLSGSSRFWVRYSTAFSAGRYSRSAREDFTGQERKHSTLFSSSHRTLLRCGSHGTPTKPSLDLLYSFLQSRSDSRLQPSQRSAEFPCYPSLFFLTNLSGS